MSAPTDRADRPPRRGERGAAVVDFVLVVVVMVPLFLAIMQLALVLHIRNSLIAAASEGARYAATVDRGPPDGAERTRELIESSLADRFAEDVQASQTQVGGYSGVVVDVHSSVPTLGLWGPAITLHVSGHAVEEQTP